MSDLAKFWIEAAAIGVAVLLIPIYMGFVHASLGAALAYMLVGGTAMSIGEQLQFRFNFDISASDVALWCGIIGAFGGVAYLLALVVL